MVSDEEYSNHLTQLHGDAIREAFRILLHRYQRKPRPNLDLLAQAISAKLEAIGDSSLYLYSFERLSRDGSRTHRVLDVRSYAHSGNPVLIARLSIPFAGAGR